MAIDSRTPEQVKADYDKSRQDLSDAFEKAAAATEKFMGDARRK